MAPTAVWRPKAQSFHKDGSESRSTETTCPSASAKTSLQSLKDKAKVFVPTVAVESEPMLFDLNVADPFMMPPPPCMPTPGKDCLAGVIQSTLGAELWNLNMMDCTSWAGDSWYTAVEVTIPALNASNCHLMTSQDTEAVEAAQQANQAKAVESITQALNDMKPNMVVQPADHRAQICVEFCAAEREGLCREFAYCGSCPRGHTCRWPHALLENFMINFILAPLSWGPMQATTCEPTPAVTTPSSESRWQPSRPPAAPTPEKTLARKPVETQSSSLKDISKEIRKDSDDVPSPCKSPMSKPLAADTRPKNPRLAGKQRWSDVDVDDDDDSLPIFSTP
jgi:hypothetical protein